MTHHDLQVDFWNVGQGDASSILIDQKDEEIVLDVIDVGPSNNQFVSWIYSQKDKRFVFNNLILTHNDSDHVNGLVAILKATNVTIKRVFLLDDRDNKFSSDSAIFLLKEKYKNNFRRLEKSEDFKILDSIGNYRLVVSYPSAADNMFFHGKPNDTSAIIQLVMVDSMTSTEKQLITWSADNKLQTVAKKTSKGPEMLFGPHHGGPTDTSEKIPSLVKAISPKQCFLSFATINGYEHPKKTYVQSLVSSGCEIICAQCARSCRKDRTIPIFDGDGYYAMTAPVDSAKQLSCHGHVRLFIDGTTVKDELAEEYFEAKKDASSSLCRP